MFIPKGSFSICCDPLFLEFSFCFCRSTRREKTTAAEDTIVLLSPFESKEFNHPQLCFFQEIVIQFLQFGARFWTRQGHFADNFGIAFIISLLNARLICSGSTFWAVSHALFKFGSTFPAVTQWLSLKMVAPIVNIKLSLKPLLGTFMFHRQLSRMR